MKRFFVILILVVLGAATFIVYQILLADNEFEGDRFVTVSRGMNFRHVVDSLKSAGVIRSRTLFELAEKIVRADRHIKIGKYLFRSGMSNKDILDDLSTGRSSMLISVTIPEGLRIVSQARIIKREVGIDSARFALLAYNQEYVRSLGIDAETLEGFLFPGTYFFYWQTEEEEILGRLVQGFRESYVDSLQERAQELGLSTNEILTLASIVEGEAIFDRERPIIAGVYYNRLKKRMRLEADPTVQYAIGNGPRRLYYSDLRAESPYNTYRNYGLPPGPINSPGRASIIAALYPTKTNYLFFAANGQGGHTFSRTYQEHQLARRQLRKMRENSRQKQHEEQ